MKSNDLKQPVNRREFLESTGRCAAALGLAGAALAPGCGPEDESPAPARRPVVDTHMHVWANDPVRYPFPHPYIPDFKYADIPAEGTTEMLIEDMDRNGVTHSILVQVIYHGWDNSYVADSLKAHPDRVRAHGLIDPTDPKVAHRLEYWVKEHGFSGMRFSPIYYLDGAKGGDGWLNHPDTDKLWKKAAQLDAVFNFYISTRQLPKLEKMVSRHPEVKVCVDHLSQIDLTVEDPTPEFKKLLALSKYPNVWVKVSELTSVSGAEYPFREAFSWVRRVYEEFGADRLLWGTGYPGASRAAYERPTLAEELALVREEMTFFSPEDVEKILGLNAARVWNLSA